MARLSKFVQRDSKLKAYDFLICLMFSRLDSESLSLQEIANEIGHHFDCSISKQSLDKRFNSHTVKFFELLLSETIKGKLSTDFPMAYLDKFNSVRIQDSTSFQLPASLKDAYGGCGGNTTGAMVRIQFEYDLKDNGIYALDIQSGSQQDVTHAKENTYKINQGDLIIRDLGFSSKAVFQEIDAKKAFYISKLRFRQHVYHQAGTDAPVQAILLKDIYKELNSPFKQVVEKEVYLDEKMKFKIRLIAEKVPDKIYEERIRKANKEVKKKGRELSKEYKLMARMNIYITNTPSETVPAEEVRKVYCIRWQVELIFKAWKSSLGIDNVKKMKKERFETQLLAKLMFIVITLDIYTLLNSYKIRVNKTIISYQKYMRHLFNKLESFMFSILQNKVSFFIDKIINTCLLKQMDIEIKKGKISSIHSIILLSSKPDILKYPLKFA